MPPLSILLDVASPLSGNVLDKADTFFQNLLSLDTANDSDKAEAILIYLEFSLARGHLKSTLNALSVILDNFNLSYNSSATLVNLQVASKLIYQEVSYPIGLKQLKRIKAESGNSDLLVADSGASGSAVRDGKSWFNYWFNDLINPFVID